MFLTEITEEIAKKATKIYGKQITKNKVLKYHCDYRKLEKAFDEYKQK
ncbi:MAG: type III toxin-antitoxin system ToxN/AbiQ family toxin [Agathobacter rectalis]